MRNYFIPFIIVAAFALMMFGCDDDSDTVRVTRVALNEAEITVLVGGDDFTLVELVLPKNATDRTVTWQSSVPGVATVNDGVVTARSAGDAVITVITHDGDKTATCTVHVVESGNPVTGVTLDKSELTLLVNEYFSGEYTLTATVTPDDADVNTVTWSSNNPAVAFVNGNGTITAIAPGTATITVTTLDGNKTATCMVTVRKAVRVWIQAWGTFYPDGDVTYYDHEGNVIDTNAGGTPEFDGYLATKGSIAQICATVSPLSEEGKTLGAKNYFSFEYQSETSWEMSIRYSNTNDWGTILQSGNTSFGATGSLDPTNEGLWKTCTVDLEEAISNGFYSTDIYYAFLVSTTLPSSQSKMLFRNFMVIMDVE